MSHPVAAQVHNQTQKKYGKLLAASILDKQENLFPTKELVKDEVMQNHIEQIEDYIRNGVHGWIVDNDDTTCTTKNTHGSEHTPPPPPKLSPNAKRDARKTRLRRQGVRAFMPAGK